MEDCDHIIGYYPGGPAIGSYIKSHLYYSSNFITEILDEYDVKFNYCPLCGHKLRSDDV